MEDLTEAWEPGTKVRDVFQNSTAVSGDVHAATDPDWQELHEKLNASIIGHGPTFCKFTGSRGKYGANDAHPEYIGWLRGVLDRKNIPWQMAELGKVDHGGGGTVALYLAAYGMDTIDLGPAVLSMHSPFELLSKADLAPSPSSRIRPFWKRKPNATTLGKGNVLKKGEPTFPLPKPASAARAHPFPSKDFRLYRIPVRRFPSLCRSVWFNISNAMT